MTVKAGRATFEPKHSPDMPESSILKDFKKLLGAENVLDAEPDRLSYAYDSAVLPQKIPAAALMPREPNR